MGWPGQFDLDFTSLLTFSALSSPGGTPSRAWDWRSACGPSSAADSASPVSGRPGPSGRRRTIGQPNTHAITCATRGGGMLVKNGGPFLVNTDRLAADVCAARAPQPVWTARRPRHRGRGRAPPSNRVPARPRARPHLPARTPHACQRQSPRPFVRLRLGAISSCSHGAVPVYSERAQTAPRPRRESGLAVNARSPFDGLPANRHRLEAGATGGTGFQPVAGVWTLGAWHGAPGALPLRG